MTKKRGDNVKRNKCFICNKQEEGKYVEIEYPNKIKSDDMTSLAINFVCKNCLFYNSEETVLKLLKKQEKVTIYDLERLGLIKKLIRKKKRINKKSCYKMTMVSDARTEEMQVELNRTLFFDYGNNIVLSKIREEGLNKYDVALDYNKIFHIIDEKSNTLFVRNIKFNKVFETRLKYGERKFSYL